MPYDPPGPPPPPRPDPSTDPSVFVPSRRPWVGDDLGKAFDDLGEALLDTGPGRFLLRSLDALGDWITLYDERDDGRSYSFGLIAGWWSFNRTPLKIKRPAHPRGPPTSRPPPPPRRRLAETRECTIDGCSMFVPCVGCRTALRETP